MKKQIVIDKSAEKELGKLSEEVQLKFQGHFEALGEEGKLDFPDARKISKDLFEIRVKLKGQYRGFYAYVQEDYVIILHIFQKKTQKTPLMNIEMAERRLVKYGQDA